MQDKVARCYVLSQVHQGVIVHGEPVEDKINHMNIFDEMVRHLQKIKTQFNILAFH